MRLFESALRAAAQLHSVVPIVDVLKLIAIVRLCGEIRKCPLFKMMQSATCLCLQVRLTLLCRYDSAPINMHAEMLSE